MLHEGEGRDDHRRHLETCADCDARYRRLVDDLHGIVAILNEPAPRIAISRTAPIKLKWAFAAAALLLAFFCGRLTSGMIASSGSQRGPILTVDSDSVALPDLSPKGALAPVSYGLYVDNLISSDATEGSLGSAADFDASDADDF